MHQNFNKTIFAAINCSHRSAVHTQRLSGENVFTLIAPFLRRIKQAESVDSNYWLPDGSRPKTSRLMLIDQDKNILDDVIITAFNAPYSFTGENVVEISTHGNPIILNNTQSFFRRIGFWDAEPGEFSKRAFLNGKLDLVQVEAINELIGATTNGGVALARDAADGELSAHTKIIRKEMIDTTAYLEAHIDFDDSEVGSLSYPKVLDLLGKIKTALIVLSKTFEQAKVKREGAKVVLLGSPNSGKSTLFNNLLKRERAIVTDIPGTTRDILEEPFKIGQRDFLLLDTAGIRDGAETVEKIGIERAIAASCEADILCFLIDFSQILPESGLDLQSYLLRSLQEIESIASINNRDKQSCIVVFSKDDLRLIPNFAQVREVCSKMGFDAAVSISTKNTDELALQLEKNYDLLTLSRDRDTPVLISVRQFDKTLAAIECINSATECCHIGDYPEIIASHLHSAKMRLEEITGEIATNDVLHAVFSVFCIGK